MAIMHKDHESGWETPAVEATADGVGEVEEIKRDLSSRHINMIAIAGMIVSVHDAQRYV